MKIELTKQEILDMLMLLSKLESWSLSRGNSLSISLQESLDDSIDILSKKLLSEEKKG